MHFGTRKQGHLNQDGVSRLVLCFMLVLALGAIYMVPPVMSIDEIIIVELTSEPGIPEPVDEELNAIFEDTLTEVLFADGLINEIGPDESDIVAEAIRTGINIVIEPKGYTVDCIELELESSPLLAKIMVHPVGWTSNSPNAVSFVDFLVEPDGIDVFWVDRFTRRLRSNEREILEYYRQQFSGLPIESADREWALGLVIPHIVAEDPVRNYMPGFEIEYTVTLGETAVIGLQFTPVTDTIEFIRPRMYSTTMYNVVLDRFRELIHARMDFIVGMPRAEIDAASVEISELLVKTLENETLARKLHAYLSIEIMTLADRPVVLVDAYVESRSIDTGLNLFVDFGNEARDSTEVQCRFGYLLTRGIEVFVNLNYFTTDNTLETDFALGFRPGRATFIAVGYDMERSDWKYYLEQQIGPAFIVSCELFEDDILNEIGLEYQFQQYMSAGVYTNFDNEIWGRAIFTL